MKILGIETSCDETAVCIVEADSTGSPQADGGLENPNFKIISNALYSQAKTHAEYGGVFPMLAKREHARNLPALLERVLRELKMQVISSLDKEECPEALRGTRCFESNQNTLSSEGHPSSSEEGKRKIDNTNLAKIKTLLERETGLFENLKTILETYEKPDIDIIAVTAGPGLEPALWVGINFAQALGLAWDIPVIPTNHMEGHILSPLISSPSFSKEGAGGVKFPAIALLISGGHTELVLIKKWLDYKVIGQTRDDAVGEAFDKVARLLDLPYPGGPEISRLAEEARKNNLKPSIKLPRPMLKTDDFDFSFSGIKTAVLYGLNKIPEKTAEIKKEFALEFENAATEVLVEKTRKAIELHGAKSVILGGGVVANTHIRSEFKKLAEEYGISLFIPEISNSTDNALMIAVAGYLHALSGIKHTENIKAQGNMKF